jgi:hypothetical protein
VKRSFKYEVESNTILQGNNRRRKREKEKKIRAEEMSKVHAEAEDLENDVKEVGNEVADVIAKVDTEDSVGGGNEAEGYYGGQGWHELILISP